MSLGNPEQIEHHWDRTKRGGEKRKCAYRKANKKDKIRVERRRAKKDPECDPHYRKYMGWEY